MHEEVARKRLPRPAAAYLSLQKLSVLTSYGVNHAACDGCDGCCEQAVLAELANGSTPVALLQPGGELPIQAPNIQAVHVDPADDLSLQRAVQDVEAVFLAWPFSPQLAEAHMRIVSAAKAAGVRRLVQLSGVGADPNMCCARMLRWYGRREVTPAARAWTSRACGRRISCRTSSSSRNRSPQQV